MSEEIGTAAVTQVVTASSLTAEQKIDFIYETMVKLDKAIDSMGPMLNQLAQSPMAGLFGGMFGR